ncbi:hypothetical protein [Brevibacterium yomogidense]|uniref:hypothetical protein n=1 Tax=Brevibacterium yomogidense TaxID=946573 RepID=UPI0018DFDFE4|nr:hypothetical protein [Brevibacterium yomogidense]
MHTTALTLALIAALCLAVGTHVQHRAVASGATRIHRLAHNPLWLVGLGLILLETVLNVVALGLAPVALIQPLGTLSLVAVVVLGLREGRAHHLTPGVVAGIALTIVSVALFVGLSSSWSTPPEAPPTRLLHLAFLLLALSGLCCAIALSTVGHVVRVVAAGAVFGAVAAGAHVLVHDLRAALGIGNGRGIGNGPGLESLLRLGDMARAVGGVQWLLLGGILAGSVAGMWVVQTAYRSGPPETVLAGLTVIDPLVAVGIGTVLLGEYSRMPAPVVGGLVIAASSAVVGILLLVRAHPAVARGSRASASSVPPSPTPPPTPPPRPPHRPASPPVPAPHGATLTNRRS